MLQFIMDQNLLLYVCGTACALGVVSQFVLRHLYGRLISETQNTGEPKGKFMRQMQQRFQSCSHFNEKVNDISSFTERNLMDYEFLKMNLHQWQRIAGEALAVCLLSCGAGLWLLYRNGAQISMQTAYSRAVVVSVLLLALAWGMTDNRYQFYALRIRLMDYFQNSGAVKEYGEVDFPSPAGEGLSETAAETASAISIARRIRRAGRPEETRAQKDKRELKENLGRAKPALQEAAAAQEPPEKEKNRNLLRQMDPKEKEQILREVLAEFLA